MFWSLTIVSYIYLQTAFIAGLVAVFVWRRRRTPGAHPLTGLLAAVMLWAVAEAVEGAAPTLDAKIMASQISHIGIQSLPVFMLLFVLRYTADDAKLLQRRYHWLWVLPLLALLAVFTNARHQLFWRHVELVASPFGLESVYHHGPLFWVATAYLYLLIVTATVLLLSQLFTHREIYRRQAALLVAATVVPWLANVLYLSSANPLPGFDWTPVAFAITGMLLAWAIFRGGLLELKPVACSVLFEQMRDALLVTDSQHRVVDANPEARALFAAQGALLGRPVAALLPPEFVRVLAAGAPEAVVVTQGANATAQFDIRISPLHSASGAQDGQLIVVRDTTDRMVLEDTLRQSEQRYRRLVDNAPFPSLVSSTVDGALLYANRRAQDLLVLEAEDVGGFHLTDFFVDACAYEDLVATLHRQGAVSDYETRLHDTVGRTFWALLSAVPILYTEEEALLASVNDITVRRAAEQTLVEAKVAAETAVRAKNEFLAAMSHELRTPLSSIIGLAEALLDEGYGALTARQKHALETIMQSGDQLKTLVSEILDLTRLEAGAIVLNREPSLVDDICRSALHTIQLTRPPSAPPLLYTIQPTDLMLTVDARRLREILIHLLRNAAKFTPTTCRIGLSVSAHPTAQVAEFVVWDEGIGIEPKLQARMFCPFAQLEGGLTRHYDGMGIGLAIVQHLVELHGGQVTVDSAPDHGSRFTVTLPC